MARPDDFDDPAASASSGSSDLGSRVAVAVFVAVLALACAMTLYFARQALVEAGAPFDGPGRSAQPHQTAP